MPSWFLIGEEDRIIPAALQHFMAERAGARRTLEFPGASHAATVSHPGAVVDLILEAVAASASPPDRQSHRARLGRGPTKTTFKEPPSQSPPIVLIHGLWLTPRSWEGWKERFEQRGHEVLAPAWPRMEGEVEALRRDPSRHERARPRRGRRPLRADHPRPRYARR